MSTKNPSEPIARTLRHSFAQGELVEFEIKNDSDQTIYLLPSLFDELGIRGTVLRNTDGNWTPVTTFNPRAASISKAEQRLPGPLPLQPNAVYRGRWTGQEIARTGPDPDNDWGAFQAKGVFKLSLYYYPTKSDAEKSDTGRASRR
jgi:hypothetical protein